MTTRTFSIIEVHIIGNLNEFFGVVPNFKGKFD